MTSWRHQLRRLSLTRVLLLALCFSAVSLVVLAYWVSLKPSTSPSYVPPTRLTHEFICPSDEGVRRVAQTNRHDEETVGNDRTEPRVLVMLESPYTRLGQAILFILESVRYKHRVQLTSPGSDRKVLPSLTHADKGRFSVIVFERLELYLRLDSWNRQLLDKYCKDFSVGIIAFAQPDEKLLNAQVKDFPLFIHSKLLLQDYYVSSESSVARVIRTQKTYLGNVPGSSWTVFVSNHSTYVPVSHARISYITTQDAAGATDSTAELPNIIYTPVVLDSGAFDGIQRIFFGSGFEFWLHRILFLDCLSFLSHGQIRQPLDRYVLVDVDDVFVGRTGVRLSEGDVMAMIETQNRLQNYVDGFRFNLGFSGKYFHRGSVEENKGDDTLIENRDKFWWFGHSYAHTKAHQFTSLHAIIDDMLHNQAFAQLHDIPVNTSYAVAPHHAGVYPVHSDLYKAWQQVWDVKVTSTEEYPHLKPARHRRGFVHHGIMVLPRQTCLLFTHTIFFNKFPGGSNRLDHAIYGGELFQTILFNQVSVFMTHMTNYGNDRLALYTFESVSKFIDCWTTLQLKTRPPLQLANYYFQLYPDETEPVWHNPCDDRRHLEIWSDKKSCDKLPNFIVIGPQKTGTTALYTFLAMHPSISRSHASATTFEEVQFFGGDNYLLGLDWYLDRFPPVPQDSSSNHLVFEKSAGYFDSELAPGRIAALLPRVKLICILDDPTRRAYSWYQHMRSHDDLTALSYSFFDVINASSHAEKPLRNLRRHCLNPGLYAQHLERWFNFFDISQIHIVDGETLRTDPVIALNRVQKFLAVDPLLDYAQLLRFNPRKGFYCPIRRTNNNDSSSTKCLGSGKGRIYPPMDAKSEALLKSFYHKSNIALSQLLLKLGHEVPAWLQTS